MMRTLYLVGNWKMNPVSSTEARHLWTVFQKEAKKIRTRVIVCPPFPYLALRTSSKDMELGAQDCFWAQKGAFTGEVSPSMLKDLGCAYVILGHSERRIHFGETDESINKKIKAALSAGLRPILAVGEETREETEDEQEIVVEKQLIDGLAGISRAHAGKILIAYEPVWAIGTGVTAGPDDVFSATLFIRKILTRLYSRNLAERIPILYGGSTDSKNLEDFLTAGKTDGALVGGASIHAAEFIKMMHIADRCSSLSL